MNKVVFMGNDFSLVGCSIKYTNNRIIKIIGDEALGRGATSVAYKCEIYIDEKFSSYGIIKEYMPSNYLSTQTVLKYSVKKDGERYISRYLPAQEQEFKNDYEAYIKTFENLRDLLNRLIREDSSMGKYIVKLPDPNDCIFEFNEEENTYVALQLYTFDFDNNMENIIKTTSIQERLEILEKLCLIIDKFHQNHLLVCDLKPQNFIYINDGITSFFRFFDFDSFKQLNERYEVVASKPDGTPYFSAPEILRGGYSPGRNADVYSVGAILLYLVCYDIFESIVSENKIGDDTLKRLLDITGDKNITTGFWNKFTDVVSRSMSHVARKRSLKGELSPMQQLHLDLVTLREIYENKGIHPEVMLNSAIEKAKEFNKLFEVDERLFAPISENNE